MELSPNDVLNLPRQTAIPILEKMVNELRQARVVAGRSTPSCKVEPSEDHMRLLPGEKDALETRLAELESENFSLKERMEQVIAMKAEAMPAFAGVVFEGQEELKAKVEGQEKTIEKLEERLSSYKTKYKELKRKMSEIEVDRNEDATMQELLTAMEPELTLDEAGDQSTPKSRASADASHMRKLNMKGEMIADLQAEAERVVQHNPWSIFEMPQSEAECSCPVYLDLKPYTTAQEFIQPSLAPSMRHHELFPVPRRSIVLSAPESKDISRILIVLPHQRFTSNANWETMALSIKPGKIIQLVMQTRTRWFYAGRYECIFTSTVPAKDVWAKIGGLKRKYLVDTTANSARKAPMAVTETIPQLYESGAFRIDCIGIRRIGFDCSLDKALHAAFKNEEKQEDRQSTTPKLEAKVKGSESKSSKRKRDDCERTKEASGSREKSQKTKAGGLERVDTTCQKLS